MNENPVTLTPVRILSRNPDGLPRTCDNCDGTGKTWDNWPYPNPQHCHQCDGTGTARFECEGWGRTDCPSVATVHADRYDRMCEACFAVALAENEECEA